MSRNQSSNRPYGVYVVEGEGDKAFWTRVGAAWPHEDRDGFNISLTALPVGGKLVIRKPKPTEDRR